MPTERGSSLDFVQKPSLVNRLIESDNASTTEKLGYASS
jgi:hypothetical protein